MSLFTWSPSSCQKMTPPMRTYDKYPTPSNRREKNLTKLNCLKSFLGHMEAIVAPVSYFLGLSCGYCTVHRCWVWIYPRLCDRQIKLRPLRYANNVWLWFRKPCREGMRESGNGISVLSENVIKMQSNHLIALLTYNTMSTSVNT